MGNCTPSYQGDRQKTCLPLFRPDCGHSWCALNVICIAEDARAWAHTESPSPLCTISNPRRTPNFPNRRRQAIPERRYGPSLSCIQGFYVGCLQIEKCYYLSVYLPVSIIYPSIYLSICMSICLPVHLSIYPSIYLPGCQSICIFLSTFWSTCMICICLLIDRTIHQAIHPSIHLSVHPSMYLSICLSFYLSIYVSFCPSIKSAYPCVYLCIYLFVHFSKHQLPSAQGPSALPSAAARAAGTLRAPGRGACSVPWAEGSDSWGMALFGDPKQHASMRIWKCCNFWNSSYVERLNQSGWILRFRGLWAPMD